MSNALVPMHEIQTMAEAVAKSGLFGVKTADQALALMLIAQAEGRHPALAARDYDIIQGRPAKKTEAMLRDFLEQDGKVEWHKLDDTIADATFSHPSGGSVRIAWDLKRATLAGLGGRDMWKKYPRQMLRSRTVSEGIRTVCPMATSGMYVPEEVRDIAREKDITPSAGVEEQLTQEEVAKVEQIVAGMREWIAQGSIGDAVYLMENAGLNAEQSIYTWTHFDSKQRSAMKREQARMKAAAKQLSAPDPQALSVEESRLGIDNQGNHRPPEVITDAARKRLEAQISELKLDRDTVKQYIGIAFGRAHFSELTKDEYRIVDSFVEIAGCTTLEQLAAFWKTLSKDDRITLTAAKDQRKQTLEAQTAKDDL
jgi:protein-tyrosine-phosphatase